MQDSQSGTTGPRAYPILEIFQRLKIGPTKGAELIRPGPNGEAPQIETFMIGRRRYATEEAVAAFIRLRIAEAQKESAPDRVRKVEKALTARAKQRAAA